jgi:hypothetical protein
MCTGTDGQFGPAGGHTAFRSYKQVDAGVLNIGYAEDSPADGPPVILVHGWPYDIPQLRRRRTAPGGPWLPGHRPVPARLRQHHVPVGRHRPQWPAGCGRR